MANTTTKYYKDRVTKKIVVADSTITFEADTTHIFAATAGGAFTGTLPLAASTEVGHEIVAKKTDASANDFTLSRAGADTIDGATTKVLGAQYDYIQLVSDGASKWHVIGAVLSA